MQKPTTLSVSAEQLSAVFQVFLWRIVEDSIFESSLFPTFSNSSTFAEWFSKADFVWIKAQNRTKCVFEMICISVNTARETFHSSFKCWMREVVVRRQDGRCAVAVVCQAEYNSSSVRTKITRGSHSGWTRHSECGFKKSGGKDSKKSSCWEEDAFRGRVGEEVG